MTAELLQPTEAGQGELHFHRGQYRAWESEKRFIVVLAGTQSGKTVFGPYWLLREIERCGPGDYMVVSPTFTLMEVKALPAFKQLFLHTAKLGRYVGSPIRMFIFSDEAMRALFPDWLPGDPVVKVFFGYAENPDSLESATLKGVWADEAGQDAFKMGSYLALRRRLSLSSGRMLITTTIYNLGWIKTELYDAWKRKDPDVDVIQFDSTENPAFPLDEYQERQSKLPGWLFDMMYRGIYTKPAGLIYDCFDTGTMILSDFPIPDTWARFAGVDFGGVNTCGLLLARDPQQDRYILYREYHDGGKSEREHVDDFLADEPKDHGSPRKPLTYGGSHQEDGWRTAFSLSGLTIFEPEINDVDQQILKSYTLIKQNQFVVFRSCRGFISEISEFTRELDENLEATEKIKDEQKFHHMAAFRYIGSYLGRERAQPSPSGRPGIARAREA